MQHVEDDDPRMYAPFSMTKNYHPTHRHRRIKHHTAMVLMRSPSLVRYDFMGKGIWGVDPAEHFDAEWEPIPKEEPLSPIRKLFGPRQKGKSSSGGDS